MKKNISNVFLLLFIIQFGCAQENPPMIQTPEVINYSYKIVVDGIDIPWGMAFINKDELLITEQAGTLYYVKNGEKKEVTGLPPVYFRGQGGLLDIALHPNFSKNKIISIRHEDHEPLKVDEICSAVIHLSSRKEGALIVIQRSSDLTLHLQSSTKLNSDIFGPLIEATFHKDNSMHDGGMYIAIGRIRAVRCVLPVTQRNDIPAELGMRHRAALGLAEKTDALIIIVSEETGLISIAMDGELHRGIATNDLQEIVEKELKPN